MIKLFVTGDNHLCRQYTGSPVKNILVQSRIDSLRQMIRIAELEECDFFIITGDLFDRISGIGKKDIDQIVEVLEEFNQTILIMPGNHDFYTGSEKLWKDFTSRTGDVSSIILLNKYQKYSFGVGDNEMVVYPAYCDSKHSKTNRLKWIEDSFESTDSFTIGIAHGTIKGISPDLKEEYFPMDITELNAIPVDAWLIGHTHITYPFDLPYNKDVSGFNIFNPGTHEQLDSGNNTEGNAFIITLDRASGLKQVFVRKLQTGTIVYKKITRIIESGELRSLGQVLQEIGTIVTNRMIIDLEIAGTVSEEDYNNRIDYYNSALGSALWYSVNDDLLVPAITLERIHDEYSELSLTAQFLESLLDDPIEVQMAYDLLKKCNTIEN